MSKPKERLGLSETDGVLHRLDKRGRPLCGTRRRVKRVRTEEIPETLPECGECRRKAGLPPPRKPAINPARRAVDRLCRCNPLRGLRPHGRSS